MDMNERAPHDYAINDQSLVHCAVCGLYRDALIHDVPATRAERKRDEALAAAGLDPEENVVVIDNTPNVVITNPNVRLVVAIVLFVLFLISGIAALVIGQFPELEIGDAVVARSITLVNQIIGFITVAFGLSVLVPNIPNKP